MAVMCRGLVKTYGSGQNKTVALRGVDIDVPRGELMMLVGPSGCGKTTLISVIAAVLNHDEGSCIVFDHDLKAMRDRDKVRYRGRNIGFCFQQFNLLPTLDCAENVAVPLLINGVARGRAMAAAKGMLDRVGLADKIGKLPRELSGGQQQRVALARALVHDPRLVVCDEPTSALDHDNGQKIMALLKEVALHPERALIVVTHDSRIFSFADRIARMDDGRVVGVETRDQYLAGAGAALAAH